MRVRRGDDNTTFLDFLFLLLLVIILLVNDPVTPTKAEATPPGNLMITIVWPDEGSQDVDLWVTSEEEIRPIGFSNRSGKYFSLLRDDLGSSNDTLKINAENVYSRDIPQGRITINLFCYTCKQVPVPVGVEVVVVKDGRSRTLLETQVTLYHHGQEITVVSFRLDDDGMIIPGSADNAFRPLYAARNEQ